MVANMLGRATAGRRELASESRVTSAVVYQVAPAGQSFIMHNAFVLLYMGCAVYLHAHPTHRRRCSF
jgi:hypothetical protein